MSLLRLICASLAYHWRIHAAVALGVMAATAVLTGALLVGDSVRGSLRHLTLDRLGRIDEALVTKQFFRAELAGAVAAHPRFAEHFTEAVPAIVAQGTIERPDANRAARANQVSILGVDARFWKLHPAGPTPAMSKGSVVLNQPLADELGAQVGDDVLLRIPVPGAIAADTPLGKKTETSRSVRLKVSAIVPAEGLGRFGLRPTQQLPLCAFTALETLQDANLLDQPGRVNGLLVAGRADQPPSDAASAVLAEILKARIEPTDFGLAIDRVRIGPAESPVSEYFNITSQSMLLPAEVVQAAQREFGQQGLQPTLTYLANTIRFGRQSIPYSTIAGVDASPVLGPFELDGPPPIAPLADDEIVLTRWAAEDLRVEPGAEISVSYYEPESTHGQLVEPPPATFRLRAVAPLAKPGEPPTRANDPHMTPELKGVTDQATIGDWDLPFELVEEIRPQDDDYWEHYRTTPKAYVSLATARKLWSSRFGDTTSLRIPVQPGFSEQEVFRRLALDPVQLEFQFLPVKRYGLQAAAGTTPFNLLFLGFSFFIIAAAVMLTMLLFRLGVEQRAREIGIAAAVGLRQQTIARSLLGEGLLVAAIGAALGVAAGVGYAWLMLAGLRTWWLAAVSTPFLNLYVTGASLALGFVVGLAISLGTIYWSLRRLRRVSARRLLTGLAGEETALAGSRSRWGRWIGMATLASAIALTLLLMIAGSKGSGAFEAGLFFGSGALMLAAALMLVWFELRGGAGRGSRTTLGMPGLAVRGTARNPTRSTLTIGLVAAASFLIVAISAFRLDPADEGTGRMALVAESDDPIVQDLNSPVGLSDLAFSDADIRALSLTNTYAFRVRAGEDASCLNLYQPTQPRVLGVPQSLIDRGGFAWAATIPLEPSPNGEAEAANPWLLLNRTFEDGSVPVVIDAATAMYSLHLKGVGDRYEIDDGRGGKLRMQVVGLLMNSIFQGDLLIGERQFLQHFPEISGSRFFLVEAAPPDVARERVAKPLAELDKSLARLEAQRRAGAKGAIDRSIARVKDEIAQLNALSRDPAALASAAQSALESTLGDRGLDATPARERLAGFLAVQNTYLLTFQSLGALGLLLGTLGLATVQLRSVLERRSELALMRAAGFRRAALARLVMWENAALLVGGLAIGVLAALVAILPQLTGGSAAVPWRWLAIMLGAILAVGLIAGLAAVRAVLRAPLLESLRGE